MKIDLFTLCDYVSNNNGRLTIVDTFDTLVADKFPWRAYFGIAVKMDISDEDYDSKNLNIHFHICKKGEGDHRLFNADASVSLQRAGKLAFAGNVKGLIFDTPGEYLFVVSSNDNVLVERAFSVKEKTKTPQDGQ